MNPTGENTSIINSLEELCGDNGGDDDKFYSVDENVLQFFTATTTATTMQASTASTLKSNYGFNLNLSNLQNLNNTHHQSSPRDEVTSHQSFGVISPRREESRFQNKDSNVHNPSKKENDIYPMADVLQRVRDVDSYFGQNDATTAAAASAPRSRRESDAYYSPRELTPREITPRREPEIYYHEPPQPRTRDGYSPRDLLRGQNDTTFAIAPSLTRRDNELLYSNRDLPRGREEGYYSPRDPPSSGISIPTKPSPRDGYYGGVGGDRPISRESDAYYGSCEPTPREHGYRRDSSDSVYYQSPRDLPSPRVSSDGYYNGSRVLTPREQMVKNTAENYYGASKGDIPSDKSVPNPYAAPFVPQRSGSNPSFGIPAVPFVPPYMNPNSRQQPQSVPYDYLQRPNNHYPVPGDNNMNINNNNNNANRPQFNTFRTQYEGPPQLKHYQPEQMSQTPATSQRPNVPPLSFTGLSSGEYNSTDSEESAPSSGYYSPKYPHSNLPRSYSGQQLRGAIPSPAGTRPHPMLKSNSEKMFDPRRPQSYNSRGGYARPSTHSSTTGNLSGRGKYSPFEDEEKALYYQITPQQHAFNIPPLPIFPLKILSLDVNGSFNSTDEKFTTLRNAFFDFIEETKAQVILMYNTGLENEDQLKIVRNEVKAKYNTESAMWASFKSPGPDGGRGVGVLVLGPLAPRTGWIINDSCGHILSASSRVKPGLPVLCFIACDCIIPPLDPTPLESLNPQLSIANPPNDAERSAKVFQRLKEVITCEQEKGVFVFAAGRIFSSEESNEESKFKDIGVIRTHVTQNQENSNSTTLDITPVPENSVLSNPDDVLVTHQPFGDGPRQPDGTGMKVLGTEALTTSLDTPHSPTLLQIAVYGWPSETFVFSQKSDTPLSSGRKSRRSKSGRKKEEQLSPQLQQLTLSSPRGLPVDSSPGSYPYMLQPQPLLDNTFIIPLTGTSNNDLGSWKIKVIEFQSRLNEILSHTTWGVIRLDQMKFLLHELFLWMERFNKVDNPGFPSSKSVSALQEIYAYNADQFLKAAPDMILQILQNWLTLADEVLNSHPSS